MTTPRMPTVQDAIDALDARDAGVSGSEELVDRIFGPFAPGSPFVQGYTVSGEPMPIEPSAISTTTPQYRARAALALAPATPLEYPPLFPSDFSRHMDQCSVDNAKALQRDRICDPHEFNQFYRDLVTAGWHTQLTVHPPGDIHATLVALHLRIYCYNRTPPDAGRGHWLLAAFIERKANNMLGVLQMLLGASCVTPLTTAGKHKKRRERVISLDRPGDEA